MPDAAVYKDDDGFWRWRLRADNGEIQASGEAYTRRADAMRGMWDAARNMAAAMDNLDDDPPEAA